jgi:hypothetical protein
LTAATDFFQQFVVAQLAHHLRQALASRSCSCWFVHAAGVDAPRYSFIVEQTKPALKKATCASSVWRVGGDFRAALWTKSDYIDHGSCFSQSFWKAGSARMASHTNRTRVQICSLASIEWLVPLWR